MAARTVTRTPRHGEAGDVILGGLFKLVLALLAIGLVLFEVGAIAVNYVQLDSLAGDAARAGASTPPQQRTYATVERAVLAELEGSGARLEALEIEGETVAVTVSRPARVLLVDRIGVLDDVVRARHTKRAPFR